MLLWQNDCYNGFRRLSKNVNKQEKFQQRRMNKMLFNMYIVWLAVNVISLAIFSIACIKWRVDRIWGMVYGLFFLISAVGLTVSSYILEGIKGVVVVGILISILAITTWFVRRWLGAVTIKPHQYCIKAGLSRWLLSYVLNFAFFG